MMAKLRNLDKIFALAEGERVTIGNNRTVTREGHGFTGRLHGAPIVRIVPRADGKASLWLDDCGFRTVTTRAAMQDFAKAFGVQMGVSFAGGEFSVRWQHGADWHAREATAGKANIIADRYT